MCSIQFHLIAVLRIFHAFVHNNWLSSWITFIFSAYNRVINKWQRTKALKTSLSLDNPWHLVNNLPPLPNAAECLSTKINHKLKKNTKRPNDSHKTTMKSLLSWGKPRRRSSGTTAGTSPNDTWKRELIIRNRALRSYNTDVYPVIPSTTLTNPNGTHSL